MRKITVKQIELRGSCRHVCIRTFLFPEEKDKGFYRSMISYSAFFESAKGRNKSDQYLFHVQDFSDGYLRSDYAIRRDAALPIIEHAGLLDFFKAIGYDRGSKKFTTKI